MVREVEHLPTQPYRRTPLWRRLVSLTELGALGFVLGALLALALAVLVGGGFLLLDRAFK
jgi:ABC-type nitrate/sulfonate/bicarbonate transport system permease component